MGTVDEPVNYQKLEKAVDLHQKPLEDLVSMNSLFTAAVFVGLTFASSEEQNIDGNDRCEAGNLVARRMVKNEVISFACFLLSSLVAKALKTHLFSYLIQPPKANELENNWSKALRGSMFALSTSASLVGEVFLLLSMIDMIQLRLGNVACKSAETSIAVSILIAVNIFALLIYVPFVAHAIVKSTKIFDKLQDPSSRGAKFSLFQQIGRCKDLCLKLCHCLFSYLHRIGEMSVE